MKKNESLGMWIAICAGIGTALGAGMKNIAVGISIGIGMGVAIGSILDYRNKKKDETEK